MTGAKWRQGHVPLAGSRCSSLIIMSHRYKESGAYMTCVHHALGTLTLPFYAPLIHSSILMSVGTRVGLYTADPWDVYIAILSSIQQAIHLSQLLKSHYRSCTCITNSIGQYIPGPRDAYINIYLSECFFVIICILQLFIYFSFIYFIIIYTSI